MSIKRLIDLQLLSRLAPSQGPAGARPAHAHERAHPEGTAQGRGQVERASRQGSLTMATRNAPTRQELAQTAQARARKKVKKNVAEGIAHVHASFNNTIVTITDRQGNVAFLGDLGQRRLQGLAQVHAVRGAGRRRARGPSRAGVRREEHRSAHQGPWPRPRVGGARAQRNRPQDRQHCRRDADSAQRLPPAEAAPSLRLN